VGASGKNPAVAGFHKWKRPQGRNFIAKMIEKWPDANVGILTAPSGLTVVDFDTSDRSYVDDVLRQIGDTPLKVRTPSGGLHCFYKLNGEPNMNLRSSCNLPIDVKGASAGYVAAPPSFNRKTGKPYTFETGSWEDVKRLPRCNLSTLIDEPLAFTNAKEGHRNNALFALGREHALYFADEMAFREFMLRANLRLEKPLPIKEAARTIKSVWRYKLDNRLWVSGGPAGVAVSHTEIRSLIGLRNGPDAALLLLVLRKEHGARSRRGESFAIAPDAMAASKVIGPFGADRIRAARNTLIDCGLLSCVHKGGRGKRDPSMTG
jgi:hypothetical protein